MSDQVKFLQDMLEKSMELNRMLMEAARNRDPVFYPPVKTPTIGCDVCGLNGSNVSQVMGYVCPRTDCPTKVTC